MKVLILAFALAVLAADVDAQGGGGRASGYPTPGAPPQGGGLRGGGRGGAPGAPGAPVGAYSQFLFAPELVMQNQMSIGLQDSQRTKIISEMSQAQAKFTEIQWTLSGEEEKLNRLLQEPAPAEQAVLAQMDRILSYEHNLKRTQMTLLVRVKNVLTPEQQASLASIQRRGPLGAGPGSPPGSGALTPGRGGRGGRIGG